MRTIVKTILFVISVVLISKPVNTLNILVVLPFEGKSHFIGFQPYLHELVRRGHNVTVISHFPDSFNGTNYHDISLAGKSKILQNVFTINRSYKSIIDISLFLVNTGTGNCKLMLSNENVQNLVKSKANFDVVVIEEFNTDCGLGLAYKLRAPVVGITSHMILPWHYQRMGINFNPSFVQFLFLEGGTKPNFFQRLERSVFYLYYNLLYKYFCQRIDQKTIEEYIGAVPPLEELAREIKVTLVYQSLGLTGSHLLPSNLIEVGGYHVAEPKPLQEDLKKFIEESKHGVIFISFGSMLRASSTPASLIQIIIDTVSELPQRIIWKWEEGTLPGNPKNIYSSKWLPQNDILAHPGVLAFYSHCGMMSTTEAIHHGVPMVGMPVFGDQPANAAAVEESGLGVQIQIRDVTKELLLEKFKTVLDPKFRENVKRISRVWHDRPLSAMDSAIFWTEFAARNQNLNLRSRSADVPYYQFLCLDILFVFLSVFVVSKYIVKTTLCKGNVIKSKRE
ncbi:UDP-glycosyltransferase UGT5-like [Amyelois transitella]|uniref:UDP-glycosyltransferase UGT5-like n=1 Tax=Amyelois transitella TaxID=680683 RepID=UPI00298F5BF8|nr:UDP-glycosyltransferase UGT5-like [Amyelois transitella]